LKVVRPAAWNDWVLAQGPVYDSWTDLVVAKLTTSAESEVGTVPNIQHRTFGITGSDYDTTQKSRLISPIASDNVVSVQLAPSLAPTDYFSR